MKNSIPITVGLWALLLAGHPFEGRADESKSEKAKPYPLDACLVCDMKLKDMREPFVFVYEGQEIKVCDKSEAADFKKAPDRYLKKLAEAEAKLKK